MADFLASEPFYARLLGRPADVHPHATEAMWRLSETGWVYVVEDAERAGNGLLTMIVADLDAALAGLRERHVEAGEVESAPGRYRRAAIGDPDGNRITLAQVPTAG